MRDFKTGTCVATSRDATHDATRDDARDEARGEDARDEGAGARVEARARGDAGEGGDDATKARRRARRGRGRRDGRDGGAGERTVVGGRGGLLWGRRWMGERRRGRAAVPAGRGGEGVRDAHRAELEPAVAAKATELEHEHGVRHRGEYGADERAQRGTSHAGEAEEARER